MDGPLEKLWGQAGEVQKNSSISKEKLNEIKLGVTLWWTITHLGFSLVLYVIYIHEQKIPDYLYLKAPNLLL